MMISEILVFYTQQPWLFIDSLLMMSHHRDFSFFLSDKIQHILTFNEGHLASICNKGLKAIIIKFDIDEYVSEPLEAIRSFLTRIFFMYLDVINSNSFRFNDISFINICIYVCERKEK